MKTGSGILTGLVAACAACNTTHLGIAADALGITSGRARALVAAVVGLISLVIGGGASSLNQSSRTWPRGRRGYRGPGAGADRHGSKCSASERLHRWFWHWRRASRSDRGAGARADRREPRWAGPCPLAPFPQHRLTTVTLAPARPKVRNKRVARRILPRPCW